MSRSYAKRPKLYITGSSNKKDKTQANKKFRRLDKILIKAEKDPLVSLNQVSEVWKFNTDGLSYWINNLDKKYLRK